MKNILLNQEEEIFFCEDVTTAEELKEILIERNEKWQKKKDGVSDCNNSLRTVVLGCIDSRVPVERIFQTKPGELLVLKNAGNLIRDDVVRSVIAAIYEINAEYVVILGHTSCGMSIKGNAEKIDHLKEELGSEVLGKIQNKFETDPLEWFGFFEEGECVENAKEQADILRNTLKDIIAEEKMPTIMSALYDLETGAVKFL